MKSKYRDRLCQLTHEALDDGGELSCPRAQRRAAEWAYLGGGDKEPCKEEHGGVVFCKVRSELLRPLLGLLDPARYLLDPFS